MMSLQTENPWIASVRRVPLFAPLDSQRIITLTDQGRRYQATAGELLFRQGDPGESLYILLSGTARIYRSLGPGDESESRELTIALIGPGDFFGELALIDGSPRSASVVTTTPCELFLIDRAAYLEILQNEPEMLEQTLSDLSRRFRERLDGYIGAETAKQRLEVRAERDRLRALAEVVTGVAHEINTPLGIVRTATSLIAQTLEAVDEDGGEIDEEQEIDPADLVPALHLIQANISRIDRLIKSFKGLSVHHLMDNSDDYELPEIIQESLSLYRVQSPASKLEIDLDIQAAGPLLWHGRSSHLMQILVNLFLNVERHAFSGDSAEEPRAALTLSRIDAFGPQGNRENGRPLHYEITIEDTGKGISEEHLPRLFVPFFTTNRTNDCPGLGLAIAHNLAATSLDGKLEVNSTLGEGTRVRLLLPETSVPAASNSERLPEAA